MLNEDQLGDFYLASRLHGQDWLLPLARLAQEMGYELTVEDAQMGGPMIRVTDLETQKWLELPMDENTEDEDIERLIREFPDMYSQLVPIEGDEDNPELAGEALPNRIVDILLEAIDPDEFAQDYTVAQSKVGGKPLDPSPAGKKVIRAVQFHSGHKLYIWRTNKRREHYGTGPGSFYGGYRFVAPNGTILFEGGQFHPGGGNVYLASDAAIALLMQGICMSPDEHEDEFFAGYTPEQLEWANSAVCREIEMDVSGDPGMLDTFPWTDLPGYEYTPQEA